MLRSVLFDSGVLEFRPKNSLRFGGKLPDSLAPGLEETSMAFSWDLGPEVRASCALVKQYAKLFELEDVALTFTDDALIAIGKKAIERKTGARGLRSIVENILLDTMFDLPDLEGVDEIVIDKDVVAGTKEPVKVIAKSSKAKKEDAA